MNTQLETLISLRRKLTNQLMSIPYDTEVASEKKEMKRLINEINQINKVHSAARRNAVINS